MLMKSPLLRLSVVLVLFSSVALTACNNSSVQTSQKQVSLPQVEVFQLHPTMFAHAIHLQGELMPYESVNVFPKTEGFLEEIYVDRGSIVQQGQRIARLSAPELEAQVAEAKSKVSSLDSERAEALAQYESNKAHYQRLKLASETPGVISENELITAKMSMEAAKARIEALINRKNANIAAVRSIQQIQDYLSITAPISGIVTKRSLHPGALVGPSGAGATEPIVHIEQINRLRLTVSIPESDIASIKPGGTLSFKVSAYPKDIFSGKISRISHSVDVKNRTELIELDVQNDVNKLAPGMYAQVQWTANRPKPTFVVPASAIVTTTEHHFVIRNHQGSVEWVDIEPGDTSGERVEIFGNLAEGDQIVLFGTDELREGDKMAVKLVSKSF